MIRRMIRRLLGQGNPLFGGTPLTNYSIAPGQSVIARHYDEQEALIARKLRKEQARHEPDPNDPWTLLDKACDFNGHDPWTGEDLGEPRYEYVGNGRVERR